MANQNDRFIDEVTEDLRRDRLFLMLRRYGWLALLLIVLLGNAVQNALLGTDTSLGGGLLLAATLIVLNYGVGWLTTRNRRMERMIEGEPTVIARDGRLLEGVLRRELISRADFDAALRQQGGLRIEDVQIALLETTGHITIIARKST